jgi:hypothetical protein
MAYNNEKIKKTVQEVRFPMSYSRTLQSHRTFTHTLKAQ